MQPFLKEQLDIVIRYHGNRFSIHDYWQEVKPLDMGINRDTWLSCADEITKIKRLKPSNWQRFFAEFGCEKDICRPVLALSVGLLGQFFTGFDHVDKVMSKYVHELALTGVTSKNEFSKWKWINWQYLKSRSLPLYKLMEFVGLTKEIDIRQRKRLRENHVLPIYPRISITTSRCEFNGPWSLCLSEFELNFWNDEFLEEHYKKLNI